MPIEVKHVVDILLEDDLWSPEEMDRFVEPSLYDFEWTSNRSEVSVDEMHGVHTLKFTALHKPEFNGTITVSVSAPKRIATRNAYADFTVLFDRPPTGNPTAPYKYHEWFHTRQRKFLMKRMELDELRKAFEEFVVRRLGPPCLDETLIRPKFYALCTAFLKTISHRPPPKRLRATPEEIAALRIRYARDGDKAPYAALAQDPRAKWRESGYDHMTSEDVRFWMELADEYDQTHPR